MSPRRRRAWAAFLFVVLGFYNSCASHQEFHDAGLALQRPGAKPGALDLLRAARSYGTDDGDLYRYRAYAAAALGLPYQAWFVRPYAGWLALFAASRPAGAPEEPDPALSPAQAPAAPLRPYRDYFLEYPPGFFAWALPPALFCTDGDWYARAFSIWMGLALWAALALGERTARHLVADEDLPRRLVAWTTLAVLALGTITVRRYDAGIALSLALACHGACARRPRLLGIGIGAAVAGKAVPIVLVPVFALHLIRDRGRARGRMLRDATLAALATGLLLGLPALAAPAGALDVLRYHALRPLQVESTLAGLLLLAEAPALHASAGFGSINLDGPGTALLARLALPATAIALVAAYLAIDRRLRGAPDAAARDRALVQGAAAAIAVFLVGGKVFSPQYLTWLLPLGLLASLSRPGRGAPILLLALALTQIIFPVAYDLQIPWSPGRGFALLLCARSSLLAAWAVAMLRAEPSRAATPPSAAR